MGTGTAEAAVPDPEAGAGAGAAGVGPAAGAGRWGAGGSMGTVVWVPVMVERRVAGRQPAAWVGPDKRSRVDIPQCAASRSQSLKVHDALPD